MVEAAASATARGATCFMSTSIGAKENGGKSDGRSAIVSVVRGAIGAAIVILLPAVASAQAPAQSTDTPPVTADQAKAALEDDGKVESILPKAPLEAPPPPPHKTGLVLESSLGAMGFAGKFGGVAPTAFWLHTQLGYEFFKILMPLIEGELAYTDTSLAADPSKNRAFPIFGFGGGVRLTIKFTPRVAMFLQGTVGAMEADIEKYALANLGYPKAEKLGLYGGGRLGLEWYQVDRHMGLGVSGGARYVAGFTRAVGSDLPLAWDGEASIRYTF